MDGGQRRPTSFVEGGSELRVGEVHLLFLPAAAAQHEHPRVLLVRQL